MTDLLKLIINNHEGLLIAYKKRFDLLYSKFDDTEKCTVDSLNIKETIKLIVGQIKEHSSTVITDKKLIFKFFKHLENNNLSHEHDKVANYYFLMLNAFAFKTHASATVNTRKFVSVAQPETLEIKLPRMSKLLKEIEVSNRDYRDFMDNYKDKEKIVAFIDPPYSKEEVARTDYYPNTI